MKRYFYLFFFAFLLSACSSIVRPEQIGKGKSLSLSNDNKLGQTFVANFNGLNGIEIYLDPKFIDHDEIHLILRESAESTQDLLVAKLSSSLVTAPGFYHFSFPQQPNSTREYYYFFLKVKGNSEFKVSSSPGALYLDGSAYQNHKPMVDDQLTFKLSYEFRHLVFGLFQECIKWLYYLIIAVFLFVLPGWVIWDTILQKEKTKHSLSKNPSPINDQGNSDNNFWSKVAIAIGISLALYPLLLLWTDIIGLHLGRWYAVFPGLIAIIILLLRSGFNRNSIKKTITSWRLNAIINLQEIAFVIILGLIIISRFWVIRTLEGPMWGDGMQHTMITQLLIDNGGLFDSWEPYAPLNTFTYHFGFHTASAVFAWLSGTEARFATLWTGQILNIFAVLALYPIATKIGGNRWAGNGAVLIAGLLSPMPMFYVNWGRYTQLTGQVILLVALFFTWKLLDKTHSHKFNFLVGGILWAGLGLTHYRVLIMGAIGILAYIFLHLKKVNWYSLFKNILFLTSLGLILFAPWLIQTYSGKLPSIFSSLMQTRPAGNGTPIVIIGDLAQYALPWIWILVPVSLGFALWKRWKWSNTFGLWWILLLIATYPHWFGLPGKDIINFFTLLISTYILTGIGLGIQFSQLEQVKKSVKLILMMIFIGLGVLGTLQRIREVDPIKHALLTHPDVRASLWIDENLSSTEDKIWIQSLSAYDNTLAAGTDGGWWLSTLTSVQISLPPLLYGFEGMTTEVMLPFIIRLQNGEITLSENEALDFLLSKNINVVYIGQQQGNVNFNGQRLDPMDILESDAWELVYHQDRVWIFKAVQ